MALCGAKTRSGKPCRAKAMANGRCRMHGGTNTGAPKENSNAVSPGALYSAYYTEEEKRLADDLDLSLIDNELRLCKIRLNRALKEEAAQDDALSLEKIVEQLPLLGGVPVEDIPPLRTKTFVRRDYEGIINRLLARIESLTALRQKLSGEKLSIKLSNPDASLRPTVIELVAPETGKTVR